MGKNPDVAPGGSTGKEGTWSQVASPAAHISLSLTTLNSPVLTLFLELHSSASLSLPFLYHCLFLWVVPGVSGV